MRVKAVLIFFLIHQSFVQSTDNPVFLGSASQRKLAIGWFDPMHSPFCRDEGLLFRKKYCDMLSFRERRRGAVQIETEEVWSQQSRLRCTSYRRQETESDLDVEACRGKCVLSCLFKNRRQAPNQISDRAPLRRVKNKRMHVIACST